MRTFKHKTLGYEAIPYSGKEGLYDVANTDKHCSNLVPAYLIENSNDREEVIEKDWILEFTKYLNLSEEYDGDIRRGINKFMPRITTEELENIYDMSKDMPRPKIIFEMKKLLRSKGLLAN